jgi:hypothetical protein
VVVDRQVSLLADVDTADLVGQPDELRALARCSAGSKG